MAVAELIRLRWMSVVNAAFCHQWEGDETVAASVVMEDTNEGERSPALLTQKFLRQ
jgi:hypothetical protein